MRFLNANVEKRTFFIILEGIAAAVILNLTNPFIQMFAKRLGAGDVYIALLNSLPPLVAIFVLIPCSIFIEKIKDKKFVTCILILINGIFYAVIAFTPFLSNEIRLIAYVVLIGLMNWPGALYTTTWQSFFSYTFKGNEVGRIYSLRSKYGALFGMLTVLVSGFVLSKIPGNDTERVLVYQLFYAACFVISIIQVLFLAQVKQLHTHTGIMDTRCESFGIKDFKGVFSNKPFMIFCGCTFVFYATWQLGWPLFFIYNVDVVKANEFQLGLLTVGGGLASFLSYSMWNRLSEKKGNNFAIIFGALGLAFNPLIYRLITDFYAIFLINVIIGIAAAGFTFILFCNLNEILPENKKTVYISVFNTVISISGFVFPLLGVWLLKCTGISMAMLIIGLLRLVAMLPFVWRWFKGRKLKNEESVEGRIF